MPENALGRLFINRLEAGALLVKIPAVYDEAVPDMLTFCSQCWTEWQRREVLERASRLSFVVVSLVLVLVGQIHIGQEIFQSNLLPSPHLPHSLSDFLHLLIQ